MQKCMVFMSHRYSSKLLVETILCFKEENGLDISTEIAEEYLDGLSGVFLAFVRPTLTGGGQTPEPSSGVRSMGASNTHGTL